MSRAKQNILSRIAAAKREFRLAEKGEGRQSPALEIVATPEDLKQRFEMRYGALGGQCRRAASRDELTAVLEEILSGYRGERVAVATSALELSPDLPEILRKLGLVICAAHPDEARSASVGITGVRLALAYGGSILLDSGVAGDLTASLLPNAHVALIPVSRLAEDSARLTQYLRDSGPVRGAALITGPSRTVDIEMTLVRGVHGPGAAVAILIDGA